MKKLKFGAFLRHFKNVLKRVHKSTLICAIFKFLELLEFESFRSRRRARGESLLELIIAVSILSTIMVGVFALLIRGFSTNVNVTNRVVAINIAREGLEAVRNIRDTNWLKYSGDRRGKWLCYDDLLNKDACAGSNFAEITDGSYLVEFSEADGRYFLENLNSDPMTDKDVLPTESFRLYKDEVSGRFMHSTSDQDITKYYRQIHLTKDSDWVSLACTTAGCPRNERLLVSVRVQWRENKAIRNLDMETYLYDFFGREEY